jgi:hypothetical protein
MGKRQEEEAIVLYKQALAKYEVNSQNQNNVSNQENMKNELNKFLYSDKNIPENQDQIIDYFNSGNSGLTITNLSENFFEKGKDFEKVIDHFILGCRFLAEAWNEIFSKV